MIFGLLVAEALGEVPQERRIVGRTYQSRGAKRWEWEFQEAGCYQLLIQLRRLDQGCAQIVREITSIRHRLQVSLVGSFHDARTGPKRSAQGLYESVAAMY